MTRSLIDYAAFYATLGWPVLPLVYLNPDGSCSCGKRECPSPGKHPDGTLVPTGLKEATDDAETVLGWWKRSPNANIGVRTGVVFDALDLDGEDGIAWFAEMEAIYGTFPGTVRARTGKGGIHLLVNPTGLGNTTKIDGRTVDWRGENGYIIVAPSSTVGPYEWLVPEERLLSFADAPAWLIEAMERRHKAPTPTNGDGKVGQGGRHDFMVGQARHLRGLGLQGDTLLMALMGINEARCDPPLDEAEVRGMVEWADDVIATDPPPDDPKHPDGKKPRESLATRLVKMAHDRHVHLFRDPAGNCYLVDGIKVIPFSGGSVTSWLRGLLWELEGRAVSLDSAKEAADTLETEARFGPNVEPVFVRVAPLPGGGIALDLGTPDWTAAVVREDGWTVEPHPVRFRRPSTLGALPVPQHGGNLNDLTALLNLVDEEQTRFAIAFLIGALNPEGPYALLALTGEQGSAKSFTARLIRSMIDPVTEGNGLKGITKNQEAFWGYAANCWLPAFDNVSGLTAEQADQFAQLATGAGRTARKLWTDGEEYAQNACRPAILNGIELSERPDLLNRTIQITLPQITKGWTVEKALLPKFKDAHPRLLGALLDAMVGVVKTVDSLPEEGWRARMADHVRWVTAAESAMGWAAGSYEDQFVRQQDSLMAEAAEAVLWLPVLARFLDQRGGTWTGSAGDLLTELKAKGSDGFGKLPDNGFGWPKSGRGMAEAMKRHATSLRSAGITVRIEMDTHSKKALYTLNSAGVAGVAGVLPSIEGDIERGEGEGDEGAKKSPTNRGTTPATPATPATTDPDDLGLELAVI